ncbi:MAG: hypothetical protein ABSA62_14250 [Methyloceanibacter sp.]|jgi:hypothetical protein
MARSSIRLTSSPAALRTGAFFRTSAGLIEIPATALPMRPDLLGDGRAGIEHASGVWLREPVRETTIFAEQYDFSLSLLLLEDARFVFHDEGGPEPDTYDRFVLAQHRRR